MAAILMAAVLVASVDVVCEHVAAIAINIGRLADIRVGLLDESVPMGSCAKSNDSAGRGISEKADRSFAQRIFFVGDACI